MKNASNDLFSMINVISIIYFLLIFIICSLQVSQVTQTAQAAIDSYNKLFPYHFTYCTTSKYETKGKGVSGGNGGHALLYIKGACKDKNSPIPLLSLCHRENTLDNSNAGAAISVNWDFKNVAFNVVDNKDFVLNGILTGELANKKLDNKIWNSTIDEAIKQNIFAGIETHDNNLKLGKNCSNKEMRLRKLISRSLLSDFAVTYGKTAYCVNIPTDKETTVEMINHLNSIQKSFRPKLFEPKTSLKDHDFKWKHIYLNCGHIPYNAFANLGYWDSRPEHSLLIHHLLKPVFPGNLFIDLVNLANNLELDVYKLYKNKKILTYFLEHKRLPISHGSTVDVFPIKENNEKFKDNKNFVIVPLKQAFTLANSKQEDFSKFISEKKYLDLTSNLKFFKEKYSNALTKIEENKKQKNFGKHSSKHLDEYKNFLNLFEQYLIEQLKDVNSKIDSYSVNK
ncbi:MAG: hypothetical protein HQK49_11295 [Oligoflexia bacterium]|nr:hypothetical protein [Oligoflexia bacterium]